jgi:hypothetical protein
VSYDRLLGDWRTEVARIEAAHGAPLPKMTEASAKAIDRFLTPELRHNDGEAGLKDLGWAGAIAGQVLAWFEAAATGSAPPSKALDKPAGELARRARDVGALVSPAARDLDAARAELLDLRARVKILEAEADALRHDGALTAQRLDAILADG